MSIGPWKVRGKVLSQDDVNRLQLLINSNRNDGRRTLSRRICESFQWVQPNGHLQDVACRDIMLKLEGLKLLTLPPRKIKARNNRQQIKPPVLELPLEEVPVIGRLGQYPPCRLISVSGQKESNYWNALIHRHHYLGYRPMVGRSLKYWIRLGNQDVGVIGWGSPSWKLASRDEFIGWSVAAREKNLQGIANNTRFLIFPWVHVKYLASHVLALCARQVPVDWRVRYGGELTMFETFVDATRYRGTCYKAANWIYVGKTKGRGKLGPAGKQTVPIKDIWLYPLCRRFKGHLNR